MFNLSLSPRTSNAKETANQLAELLRIQPVDTWKDGIAGELFLSQASFSKIDKFVELDTPDYMVTRFDSSDAFLERLASNRMPAPVKLLPPLCGESPFVHDSNASPPPPPRVLHKHSTDDTLTFFWGGPETHPERPA